jgi:hypothetical protein
MTGDQKKEAGCWIAVALLAVPVLHPLSPGPACWISSRTKTGPGAVSVVYRPLIRISKGSRRLVTDATYWYSSAGAAASDAGLQSLGIVTAGAGRGCIRFPGVPVMQLMS